MRTLITDDRLLFPESVLVSLPEYSCNALGCHSVRLAECEIAVLDELHKKRESIGPWARIWLKGVSINVVFLDGRMSSMGGGHEGG